MNKMCSPLLCNLCCVLGTKLVGSKNLPFSSICSFMRTIRPYLPYHYTTLSLKVPMTEQLFYFNIFFLIFLSDTWQHMTYSSILLFSIGLTLRELSGTTLNVHWVYYCTAFHTFFSSDLIGYRHFCNRQMVVFNLKIQFIVLKEI